jgi:glycosyltransferase involved in cell wall biosynthesis
MEAALRQMAKDRGTEKYVRFYGEQSNPYRYMKNANLFLMTSFYEAAPMVIDEAALLGVPILTTRTTSSQEMVTERDVGWVCENDQEALNNMLLQILSNADALSNLKRKMCGQSLDNHVAMRQFNALIEE